MRFFKQVPSSFTIAGDTPFSMEEPDREDLRAAVVLLRQIYTPSEPTSAAVVLNILKKSAHERGGPSRDEAISELKALGSWVSDIVKGGIGIGVVFEHGDSQSSVEPAEILDAYFTANTSTLGTSSASSCVALTTLDYRVSPSTT